MVIAYTRTLADLSAPVPAVAVGMSKQCLYAIIDITTIAVSTDAVTMGYLPKGAIPVGGYLACVDLDTGAEALDMDLGILANGVDSADTDFFVNGGTFTGDAITDLPLTNSSNIRFMTGPFPVTQLGARTEVSLLTNTAANATGTGKVVICIDYLTPGVSTS